ncbi:hypothetical protein BV22DRAFT_985479, partial [Leucogyrophana mollusca]
AVQWYDILQVQVERDVEAALQSCRDHVRTALDASVEAKVGEGPPTSLSSTAPLQPVPPNLTTGYASSILRQRCPACFGGSSWGRPLTEGGDVHCASDGNFHHRHRRSAGDCPPFYDPAYVLPKDQVDAVGARIDKLRKKKPRKCHPPVPHEVLDQCERSYEAADGKKQKAAMESFDDPGFMSLICRHDIPLFFANIDTPGEQQKYAVALLEHLFSLLPLAATVTALYDVGCVLSRSLDQYEILPDPVMERLRFSTTAMHAYGHEWSCQLVYNPRFSEGLGLSDGEGVERLWSRIRRLISIQRSSARKRCIWLVDRQAKAIREELRDDLGDWIRRRLRRGVQEQGENAHKILRECGLSPHELEEQWRQQKASQLSLRAHAPARLKKELDTVLTLQTELDASDKALHTMRAIISTSTQSVSNDTISALESLERGHDRLISKVEQLYASLNVHEKFPELKGIDLEFVRTLLIAHDLKINIRKRAIGSFFEWDKLNQAVGGQQQTLGTKLHQHTRKAIAKHQPALMTALRKFNTYCERMEELYDPSWKIPLPKPLPTKLSALRNDQRLMEDVWITPAVEEIPQWLEELDVRDGIRALLRVRRCSEEQDRLAMEAENLCTWFTNELAAVELALRAPNNSQYNILLQHRRDHLSLLQSRWATSFIPAPRFQTHANEAVNIAISLSGATTLLPVNWTTTVIKDTLDIEHMHLGDGLKPLDIPESDDTDPEQTVLTDVLTEAGIDDPE